MTAQAWEIQSATPGSVWPALPTPRGARVLALLQQLERSQWFPSARLHELQMQQAEAVLSHAYSSVPYYRERWRGLYDPALPLTPERFAALPVLTRRDLQEQFQALRSSAVPALHGAPFEARSSGSSGMPVRMLKTQLAILFWNAFTLRDHLWHGRDLRGRLAAIRHGVTPGEFSNWGQATEGLIATGPSVVLGVRTDVEAQLDWLAEQRPDYLLSYPSNLGELARRAIERKQGQPGLREVRTVGELLGADVRDLCRRAWGVPLTDMYSAEETGYIALQCPQHEHYHVQSEDVLVEVLDDHGASCAPGEVGRMVVTSLHNFAMPLVRYELGDFAEVGEACPCGRGLPVLRRIIGRVRNMLVTAGGGRFWPSFGMRSLSAIAALRQHQFIQKSFDRIEARLVVSSPLAPAQEDGLRQHILSRLPHGFNLDFVYCTEIPRSAGGKFEDFISEVAVPARNGVE